MDPKQTEQKFGGECPNLKNYWPPKSPFETQKILISNKTLHRKGLKMF